MSPLLLQFSQVHRDKIQVHVGKEPVCAKGQCHFIHIKCQYVQCTKMKSSFMCSKWMLCFYTTELTNIYFKYQDIYTWGGILILVSSVASGFGCIEKYRFVWAIRKWKTKSVNGSHLQRFYLNTNCSVICGICKFESLNIISLSFCMHSWRRLTFCTAGLRKESWGQFPGVRTPRPPGLHSS